MVKTFVQNGYKANDIFQMKLKDILLMNEMLGNQAKEEELTEDFLSLLF